MVRPLLGSTALGAAVFVIALPVPASAAEPLPFACEAGIVLGGADAMDVVARGCEVARAKSTSGRMRIGVVATGSRVVVTATRVADASGVEQTARSDTASIEEAMQTVPRVVEAVLPQAPPPVRPPPPLVEAPPLRPPPPLAEAPPPKPAPPPVPPRAPTEVAGAAPESPAPSPPERMVRVDVNSEKGLRLLRSRDGASTWETACDGSCRGVELPLDASYRVVDQRGRAVRGFRLDPNGSDRLTLDVSPRSTAIDVVSITGIVAGAALFVGGVSSQDGTVSWLGILTGTLGIVGVAVNGTSVSQRAPGEVEPAPRPAPLSRAREARSFGGTLVSVSF